MVFLEDKGNSKRLFPILQTWTAIFVVNDTLHRSFIKLKTNFISVFQHFSNHKCADIDWLLAVLMVLFTNEVYFHFDQGKFWTVLHNA